MWNWFKPKPRDPNLPNLPKINDIRIVQLTHYLPDGSTYDKFEVQRYQNYDGDGWYGDYWYDTLTDAEARAEKLVKELHPVKVVAVVVKEYKQ